MAQIILTFEWDGKTVHKEVKGLSGKECVSKTSFIETALGTFSNRRFKSEYYEDTEKESEKEKNQN